MPAGLGDGLRAFASEIGGLEDALRDTLEGGLREIARVAVNDYILPRWPVLTGYSRDRWAVEPIPMGARIVCRAEYSSYVFRKQDDMRTPIYLRLVPWAVSQAAARVGLDVVLRDVTAAYVGQGRTTSHLTGVHRKFLRHAPPRERKAWLEEMPELIESIRVDGKIEQVVPSDTLFAGQFGQVEIRGSLTYG